MAIKTVQLFHGPGAQAAARAATSEDAPIQFPNDGGRSLKVEDARQIVELLWSVPVGDRERHIVVGPIDMAAPKSSDVLLKAIEEPRDNAHIAVLWADDLASVSPTIRSRCLAVWAPGSDAPDEMAADADQMVRGSVSGDCGELARTLERWKGREMDFLASMAKAVARSGKGALGLWPSLRAVAMDARGPTSADLAGALAKGSVR